MKKQIKTRFINKIMSRCNYCREAISVRQMSRREDKIDWRTFITGMGICPRCWLKL